MNTLPPETSLTWLARLATHPSGTDWQRLVEIYAPLLRQWFASIGVPEAERDDLVQEVLMVVVGRVADFEHRGPGAFRAWLRGIVLNQSRKYFRDRRKSAAVDLNQLADDQTPLSRQWDREHDEYLTRRALQVVKPDFAALTWQAFTRYVLDDQAPAAVAIELGCSVNSVLLAKSRVLKRLRSELRGLVE